MSKAKDQDRTAVVPITEVLPFWGNVRGFSDLARLFDGADLRVEEFQEDGEYVVRAEMPGVDPDKDVDITIRDGRLHIDAHRTQQTERKDAKHYRSELRYGAFHRTLPLPADVVPADVKATYRDGMLEVRVPVDAQRAVADRIPIEHA